MLIFLSSGLGSGTGCEMSFLHTFFVQLISFYLVTQVGIHVIKDFLFSGEWTRQTLILQELQVS